MSTEEGSLHPSKRWLGVGLTVAFVAAVLSAVWFITKTSDKAVAVGKPVASNNVLTPDFVPNEVKYESKEPIRVYREPPSKRELLEAKAAAEKAKKEAQNGTAGAHGGSAAADVGLPPYLKATTICQKVTQPAIFSLVKSSKEIQGLEKQAFWTAKNLSIASVGLILQQNSKDIVVVFLPAGQSITTSIPATPLKVMLRASDTDCVDWAGGFGLFHTIKDPGDVDGGTGYDKAIFETVVVKQATQYVAKTAYQGRAER